MVTPPLQAQIQAAQEAFQQARYEEALALYHSALAQAPHHRGLYPAAGRCLLRLHRAEEARALLAEHLATEPDSVPGLIGLAEVERQQRHWAAALELYAQAQRLQPDHAGIAQALGHLQRQLRDLPGTALGPPECLTVIPSALKCSCSRRRRELGVKLHIHWSCHSSLSMFEMPGRVISATPPGLRMR